MIRLRGRVRWIGGVMALVLALASVFANSVQTVQDKQKVSKMTDKMKTICVGRFLIDLPVDATVHIERGFVSGYDVASTERETDDEFAERVRKFETEPVEADSDTGRREFESVKSVSSNSAAQGKVFVYNRRKAKAFEGKRIVAIEDVDVHGMLRLPGVSVTATAAGMALDSGDELARLLGQFRALGSDEIPRESGFCIGHAMVRDPYEHPENESVVMFAGVPGHPDVNIVLSSMAGTDPTPGLLARHAASTERQPVFMRLAFTHLREHSRTINGLTGDELVMRVLEPNFTTGYSFQWEMAGRQDDIYAPLLTLELESGINPAAGGKPVQSTLSEEAMFDLWDRIASSIRLRPTEPESANAPEETTVALGTVASAGDACPYSGWWQCSDGNREVGVFGGQQQFIRQGQRIPQALLLPPQTVWQRLRGVQPSFESSNRTLWTLVDKRSSARLAAPAGLEQAIPRTELLATLAGDTPTAHVEPSIGSMAKTGAACPASGWWRCEDTQALDGTRWFAAGALLPAATFRALPGRNGVAHTALIHRRSAWQLVRKADSALES